MVGTTWAPIHSVSLTHQKKSIADHGIWLLVFGYVVMPSTPGSDAISPRDLHIRWPICTLTIRHCKAGYVSARDNLVVNICGHMAPLRTNVHGVVGNIIEVEKVVHCPSVLGWCEELAEGGSSGE